MKLYSVLQHKGVVPIIIHVTAIGKGACCSMVLVYSSVEACVAEPKITGTVTRDKLMENFLSPMT
jgi:hypothetical protein